MVIIYQQYNKFLISREQSSGYFSLKFFLSGIPKRKQRNEERMKEKGKKRMKEGRKKGSHWYISIEGWFQTQWDECTQTMSAEPGTPSSLSTAF